MTRIEPAAASGRSDCGRRTVPGFSLPQRQALVAELRARAAALGFESFGVAAADARPDLPDRLATAIAAGWHGDMDWMAETAARRGRRGRCGRKPDQ